MYLDFFFSFFLYLLKKKLNPNSHGIQELQTAQACNCLCREQWMSSLKNALRDSELTCKVIFVISQHLQGHPHPWLHHSTHHQLQLQRDNKENKEINSKLVRGKVNTVSDHKLGQNIWVNFFFLLKPHSRNSSFPGHYTSVLHHLNSPFNHLWYFPYSPSNCCKLGKTKPAKFGNRWHQKCGISYMPGSRNSVTSVI